MNELIRVTVKDDVQLVSARELHHGLMVSTRFSQWAKQNFKMFVENTDYWCVVTTTQQNQWGGTKQITDYAMTIDMAKQVSLMSQTKKGEQYRSYFIELEKKWNDPAEVVKRGYAILQNENLRLKAENKSLLPKAKFADSVDDTDNSVLIRVLAKIIKQNGIDMGEKRLFEWLRANGYLIKKKGADINIPTQKSLNMGLMTIKETVLKHSNGTSYTTQTPKITGKGQTYFVNKLVDEKQA